MDFQEGQTATNPKTGATIVFKGGQWVNANPPGAPGSPVAGRKLSPQDQKELDAQLNGAAQAWEVKNRMTTVAPAAQRLSQDFGTGPVRGALLDAAIPSPGGGFWDKLGAAVVGGPARLTGYISDQNVKDYQELQRAAMLGTRQSETGERGAQTEGDAARALMSTVGPSQSNNAQIIQQAAAKADRQISRANFYTQWANKYGSLSSTDPNGQGVETAFQSTLAAPTNHNGPTIRRIK